MSSPSLMDVRHRARRRQQRRTAGLVGAITLVGAGGVGAYALRHDDGRVALSPGDADANGAPPSTTVACFTIGTTTIPVQPTVSTVLSDGTYTVQAGDIPALVAQKFDVTVEELDAANAGLYGYDAFYVGLSITIPGGAEPAGTVAPNSGGCGPDVQWTWHCTGELGMDEFGRQIFESCEQVEPTVTNVGEPVPTTVPGTLVGTTTTFPPDFTSTTLPPTTVPTSVNGNVDATSTTNVEYESTTTSLG